MLLLVLLCSLLFSCFKAEDQLIFVHSHFRHGARNPPLMIPSRQYYFDPFGERWQHPFKLTGVGQRMHYLLGLRNRIKYVNEKQFLPEKYSFSELKIYCSDNERTVRSLLSHLQGLYPQSEKLGEKLTEVQLTKSNPPLNINNSRILEEISYLKNYALPEGMTLVNFTIINEKEGFNIYEMKSCDDKLTVDIDSLTNESILMREEFMEKYSESFNKILGLNYTFDYPIKNISIYCEAFIPNYYEGRNVSKLIDNGINFTEFHDFCIRHMKIDIKYKNNNTTALLRGSKMMKMIIENAKKKIDADIKGSSSNDPKMLIISGHDTSLSVEELFLIYSLGLDLDNYKYPSFASQSNLEFSRKDDNNKNRTYSDYFVNYYFNDEHLFNLTAKEFFEKIEAKIWSEDEMITFCSNNSTNNNKTNNINNNNNSEIKNNDNSYRSHFKKKDSSKSGALIVFICLFVVSFIINLILALCLHRKRSIIPNQQDKLMLLNLQ